MDIDIPNLPGLIIQIAGLENLIGELAEPTEEVLQLLKKRMQEYPPERPGQTYIRTGTLKNGWDSFVILSGDRLGMIRNTVSYGPYVQGAEDQAWMHSGRWQTDRQVGLEKEDEAGKIYEAYLQQRLNQIR